MSPIVTPDDLGVYLAVQSIDEVRAAKLIDWAQALCESVITPLPTGAEPVVLDVTARAYSNPTSVTQQSVLSASASYGAVAGGMWLTRENKAALRRLAGASSVFTFDMTDTVIPGPLAPGTGDFDQNPS